MKCLIVKHPYIDQLLAGTKPIEFRSRPTNVRGKIGLIASGGRGQILGTIELFDCTKGPAGTLGGEYHWHMRNPVRFDQPQQCDQRPGCVIWVNS